MELDAETSLIKQILSGERLVVHTGGIVASTNNGASTLFLALIGDGGKPYVVSLSRDFALSLGEQLVRAADAVDAGLTLPPEPPPRL